MVRSVRATDLVYPCRRRATLGCRYVPAVPAGPHLVIVGPTAAGKTALSIQVAVDAGAEVISADALMVYRGADIGTAKPTWEERRGVRHHGIDLVEPSEDADLAGWLAAARGALASCEARGVPAVVVGGTGLYVHALVDDFELPGTYPDVRAELEASPEPAPVLHARLAALDPVAASRMEPGNRRRVVRALEVCLATGRPFSSFGPGVAAFPPTDCFRLVGLAPDPERLAERIERRVHEQAAAGLVEETARLLATPGGLSRTCRQGLGYKEVLLHLEQGLPLEAALALDVANTRRFARRQRSWFRRDPRIRWSDSGDDPLALVPAAWAHWHS
jgi:tRNA dimethylallyltransferase